MKVELQAATAKQLSEETSLVHLSRNKVTSSYQPSLGDGFVLMTCNVNQSDDMGS